MASAAAALTGHGNRVKPLAFGDDERYGGEPIAGDVNG